MSGTDAGSKTGKDGTFPADVGVLLGVFVAALIVFQYTTMNKFAALQPAVRYVLSREAMQHIQSQDGLNIWDAIGFGLIASLFWVGVILEVWRARLTQTLGWVFASERRTYLTFVVEPATQELVRVA
jgi:hypothetical protein